MDSELGFLAVGGATLRYEEAGEGEPIVFLHGLSLDLSSWDGQFERFAGGFRSIRYDLRGFGQSSLPSEGEPYSHVDDLKVLLEALDVDRAALIGFSMGGGIALDFALTYPEAVRALILADSTLGGYRWTDAASALYRDVIRRARVSGVEAARQLWKQDPMFEHAMASPEVAPRLARMISSYSGWHWLHRDPLISLDPPAIGRLGEVTAPVLVIVGELDVSDMHEIAAALQTGIPDARKIIVPGAGHLSNMESPEQFNETVERFLV